MDLKLTLPRRSSVGFKRMKTALNNLSLKTGNGQRYFIKGAYQELDELETLTSGFEVEVRYQK